MRYPLCRDALRWLLFIAFGAFWMVAQSAPSVKIISDAFEGKAEVEETFHITIEATDCAGNIDMSKMPPGVKVVYHTTRQTNKISTINGVTEQVHTTSLILTCKGQQPGKYTFGPVSVDGKKSNTISYQIVPATPGKQRQGGTPAATASASSSSGPLFIGKGNEEMYLRAYVNKNTAYEQEAIEYTVKLYTTYGDIKFLGAAAAPKFEGFVIEESPDVSTSFSFEDLNGKTFKTAVIARYIIFPQKAGRLKVIGNTYTVSTDAKQYYHDPYYQTITVKQPVQLNVTPNDVVIDVKDLPTPIPENFMGGVGKFHISSQMPSTGLTTNSASSLVYTITGSGNLKYVKLPELSSYFPKSFEIYTPEESVDAKVENATVTGSARFDYSIIPRESGEYVIPALTFSYFDPEEGTYKTLHTQHYDVKVNMGVSSSKSQQAISFNSSLLPSGKISRKVGEPYVDSFLYWLWYVVPVIIFIVTLGIYRKHLSQRDNMVLFRSKNANKMALKRLAKAYQCIRNQKEEQFYDEMLQALWGYLADKLKIPTSSLNRSNVGEEFKKHNVRESTFMPIINLIDECEYAKYTPVARKANMNQLYTEAVESLSKVESEYEEETGKSNEDEDSPETIDGNYVNSTDIGSADSVSGQNAKDNNGK